MDFGFLTYIQAHPMSSKGLIPLQWSRLLCEWLALKHVLGYRRGNLIE